MTEILKAHGSKNDIFIAQLTPADFRTDADLREFVRALCDRSGPLGGDGIYFYDAARATPQAWFVNPDGSSAEFCGNGMRCLGRVILDTHGVAEAVIQSGSTSYTAGRGPVTPEGVQQIRLEHPRVGFQATRTTVEDLDPAVSFTALTVPNPHLITLVDKYVEADLVAMGEILARRHGPNLSFLLPMTQDDIFVRTFERGAGLTASCGSGMAAARAVYSRVGHADPDRDVLIRNAGGMATASLRVRDGRWFPVLHGNATFVYRADIDPEQVARAAADREPYPDEIRAYATLDEQNAARLQAAGVHTF